MSLSGGRDGGYSGSPGDGNTTCTQCHSGGNFNASVALQTEVPATGYELGTTYGLQVDVSTILHGQSLISIYPPFFKFPAVVG